VTHSDSLCHQIVLVRIRFTLVEVSVSIQNRICRTPAFDPTQTLAGARITNVDYPAAQSRLMQCAWAALVQYLDDRRNHHFRLIDRDIVAGIGHELVASPR
jgi:hypothetical protein